MTPSTSPPDSALAACPQCGALVPDEDGPVHAYVPSSPGCWRTFGELQAEEYRRFGYPPAHRLVVDAYMAQHPGDGSDRRERQSVFFHLVALCATLERGWPVQRAAPLLERTVGQRRDFPVLTPPPAPAELTLLHMQGAKGLDDYEARARNWAEAVWSAWSHEQDRIRQALDQPTSA